MSGTVAWAETLWLSRQRTPNDRLRYWGSTVSSALTAALVCTVFGLLMVGVNSMIPVSVGVIADAGTRGGVLFALALMVLPALHLTGQAWRLGSIEQRQRFDQLRDAGAGPRELRRVAVADAVVPVFLGSVVGVLTWGAALVAVNDGVVRGLEADGSGVFVINEVYFPAPQVPNVVTDTPWAPVLAVIAVTLAAAASAVLSVRTVRARRSRRSALASVAAAAASRASHPALLLALRRLAQEPHATARPALLLGLAAAIAGSSAWLNEEFELSLGSRWAQEPYWEQSFGLVRLATVIGIALCAFGLLVVLAESTFRRRREDAAAVASGVPLSVLRRALVLQSVIPAVPAILIGLVGSAALAMWRTGLSAVPHSDDPALSLGWVAIPWPWMEWLVWGFVLVVVAGVAALAASTALTRTTKIAQLRVPA